MGQKVNPEIFKLSRTAGWKSKYIEKKKINLGLSVMRDLKVKTFIKQFFTKIGITVHSCKIAYFNNRIVAQINYIKSSKLVDGIQRLDNLVRKESLLTRNVRSTKNKKLKLKTLVFLTFLYKTKQINKLLGYRSNTTKHLDAYPLKKQELMTISKKEWADEYIAWHAVKDILDPRGGLNQVLIKNSIKRGILSSIRHFSTLNQKALNKINNTCNYNFINLFCKSFSVFYEKPLKVTLIFKALQKNLLTKRPKLKKNALQKKMILLRKHKRSTFFNKGINLMFLIASQKESADLIASYVAYTLRNFKKHKLFLKFIQKGLHSFSKNRSVVKAIKIQLKGRINGADRARSYTIKSGNQLSLLTTSSRINYSEKTTFTPDGTLSVKVWVKYSKTLKQFKSKNKLQIQNENLTSKNKV